MIESPTSVGCTNHDWIPVVQGDAATDAETLVKELELCTKCGAMQGYGIADPSSDGPWPKLYIEPPHGDPFEGPILPYLTQAQADAQFSKLGHTHSDIWSALWNFNITTSGDPGSGKLALNHADPTLATEMRLSKEDAEGVDRSGPIKLAAANDWLQVQDRDDATKKLRYTVIGPWIDQGNYVVFPVVYTAVPGAFIPTNNMALINYWARLGHP